jgi:multidrug transporter EmrE-like cation transporter
MRTLVLALLSIAISVAAQFTLKAGMSDPVVRAGGSGVLPQLWTAIQNRYVLGGLFLYGFGALLWLTVLREWDVSKAYPLVGLGFVMSMMAGYVMGEAVTPARIAGALCICGGVLLIARS